MTTLDRPAPALPRWDVTDVFGTIGSPRYAAAREELGAEVHRLRALFDEHDVRGGDKDLDDAAVAAFEATVGAMNELLERLRTLAAFIAAHTTTDARDEAAQAERAGLQVEMAELTKLRGRFDAWVAALGPEALAERAPAAADHAFALQRAAVRAEHQMSEAEEALYADLAVTGSGAWGSLYRELTARLVVDVPDGRGGAEPLPMSAVRGRAHHPDAGTRRRAYEAELAAWQASEVPIVAALNAMKGEAITVNRRRGWSDELEPALVANNVDAGTLAAMQEAVVGSFPTFRRYLRLKARLLGHDGGLPWFDLFAPLPQAGEGERSWSDATDAVLGSFAAYSDRLAGLAKRAFDERWVDAEPREGKEGGAFCMGVAGDRSLVLLNFDGSARAVQTLAHELGHAYHNANLADRTPLQRQTPMALAETASIFCETALFQDQLRRAGDQERVGLLESDLQAATQVVVDIHSRFLFEKTFCEARRKRPQSAGETCDLMLAAQDATYGDGLAPDARHAYMWAAKPHYYGAAFYNWPYTFGLLFGLGLYARYEADPERFRSGYDDLLSSTGLADAATLGRRFGIDVADAAFWAAGLSLYEARVEELEKLTAG